MQATGIEWTDLSSNLLKYRDNDTNKIVWACAKVSDGCKNCYSETLAHRYGKGGPFSLQQVRKVTPFFDMDEAKKILRSKKIGGKRIFIDDMTDLFGEWVPDEIIDKHFALFALRPDVTFQVLTKRPERIVRWMNRYPTHLAVAYQRMANDNMMDWEQYPWPLPNVWLGTSCENQATADERIPHLLKCTAAVRFISAEPLLGPIDLSRWMGCVSGTQHVRGHAEDADAEWSAVDWVIVGGESGHHARPCNVEWVRSIIAQCSAADVACFVKQVGSRPVGTLNGVEVPVPWMKNDKGGNPSTWPEDLRVREMPDAKVPA